MVHPCAKKDCKKHDGAQNFEVYKNREDSSDFDDFWSKSIATIRTFFGIFVSSKICSRRRNKFATNEKNRKKQSWSQMIDLVMTINSVQKSSKTELSSTLFGLFKVLAIERPERAEKCTS